MSNITYVKTPTFIVNANGRLSESLRPDDSKGQKSLIVQTHNFESLKAALVWINKEGQKKSSILYLYEIRPSVHGAYNVRCATYIPKKVVVKKATNSNAKPNANANRTNSNAKPNANANRTNSNAKPNANANRTNTNANANSKANVNTTNIVTTKSPITKAKAVAKPNANNNANRNTRPTAKAMAKTSVNSMTKKA